MLARGRQLEASPGALPGGWEGVTLPEASYLPGNKLNPTLFVAVVVKTVLRAAVGAQP